jgi:hypothetical protein
VADFYAEVPGGLKDLDPSPVCRVFTSMPSMRRNIDVPQFGPFAGKLRTGTVVMEFVAAPVRQREPSSHADGGKIGGQVGQPVGDQKLRIERNRVRNLWPPNGAVLSIPGRQRRDSN